MCVMANAMHLAWVPDALGASEIAYALGLTTAQVAGRLRALRRRGLVEIIHPADAPGFPGLPDGVGVWVLTDAGEAEITRWAASLRGKK